MIAVKLHKRKRPNLHKGSFLVPVRTWHSGRKHVGNWIRLLNRCNRGNPNDCIRYITLVKIPDGHPVFIGLDWVDKPFFSSEFIELEKIDAARKARLDLVPCEKERLQALQAQRSIALDAIPGSPIAECPELILGKALPARFIKWTKDVRLLYGRSQKPSDLRDT